MCFDFFSCTGRRKALQGAALRGDVQEFYEICSAKGGLSSKNKAGRLLLDLVLSTSQVRDKKIGAFYLLAAKQGELEILKYLDSKLFIKNICNSQGENALHLAVKAGHLDCAEFLLNHYASLNDFNTNQGKSAVELAKTAKMRKLLEVAGTDDLFDEWPNRAASQRFPGAFLSAPQKDKDCFYHALLRELKNTLDMPIKLNPAKLRMICWRYAKDEKNTWVRQSCHDQKIDFDHYIANSPLLPVGFDQRLLGSRPGCAQLEGRMICDYLETFFAQKVSIHVVEDEILTIGTTVPGQLPAEQSLRHSLIDSQGSRIIPDWQKAKINGDIVHLTFSEPYFYYTAPASTRTTFQGEFLTAAQSKR